MAASLDPGTAGPTPSRALPPLPTSSRLPQRSIGSPMAGAPTGIRPRQALEPNATIVARSDVSRSVARFVVRADVPPGPFRAGQYLALGVVIDGRLVQRPSPRPRSPTRVTCTSSWSGSCRAAR